MNHQEWQEPLMSYRDRQRLIVDRTFELHEDRMRILATVGVGRAKVNLIVPLENIVLPPNRLWVRSGNFKWGGRLALVSVLGLIAAFLLQPASSEMLLVSFVGLAAASFFLAFYCRRMEFKQYRNTSGVVVFDIGRIGPDAATFDAFNAKLAETIEAAKTKARFVES